MSRELFFIEDQREKLQKGFDFVESAAGSTLGPEGSPVIISAGNAMPIATKDGVTVVKSCYVNDEIENTGVLWIRYAAEKTLAEAGDGTTTASILTHNMITAGLDVVRDGANRNEVKSGMEKAVSSIVKSLKEISIEVSDNEMIKNIATTSANNDEEIGSKLADAYDRIGLKGLLTIEKSKTSETYITITEGAEMQRGYANDKFVNNQAKMLVEYDNPYILVLNYDVKTIKEMESFLNDFAPTHNLKEMSLIIIAKGFEGEPHNTFVVNKTQYGANMCLIEAPNMYQREALVDIATLTGATLITDDAGLKIEHAKTEHLGRCEKIIVSKTSTLVVGGKGDKEEISELKRQIQLLIDTNDNVELKEVHEKRLARLSGSIGVIYVGGKTEVEQKERIDRVDDANRAVKSAIEEGVVAGGGIALIRCANKIDAAEYSKGELVGKNIIYNACLFPLNKMLDNAGIDKLTIVPIVYNESGNKGYNVKTKQFVDMIEAKIIDPTKVVRCALENSASVAAQVINSKVMLIEMRPQN